MTGEQWSSATDVLLGVGTLALAALSLGLRSPLDLAFTALYASVGVAALLAAVYHAIDRPWKPRLWTVTSAVSTASYVLFLVCAGALTWPAVGWVAIACPVAAVCGLAAGVWIAERPFYFVSAIAAAVTVASAVILIGSPYAAARAWVYAALAVTVAGVVLQKVLPTEGALNNNVAYHLLQLLGNLLAFIGTRAAL